MILKDIEPAPSLKKYIQCYRIVHFEFNGFSEIPFKLCSPKPEICLHFILEGTLSIEYINSTKLTFSKPVLAGQFTSVYKRQSSKKIVDFQIVFQPSALFFLAGIPGSEVTDQYKPATEVFSNCIDLIHERLMEANTINEKISIANEFVIYLINCSNKATHLIDETIHKIINFEDRIGMNGIASESCLCTKQFKRKFHERIGVNPKAFLRIARFNRAYNIKNKYPEIDWLRIAINCGYYDYQHLVRDYKDFTSMAPTEFHTAETQSPECLLGMTGEIYRSRAGMIK